MTLIEKLSLNLSNHQTNYQTVILQTLKSLKNHLRSGKCGFPRGIGDANPPGIENEDIFEDEVPWGITPNSRPNPKHKTQNY
jgi:hypothetical protein